MTQEASQQWQGTPLDMGEKLDPYSIQELRIEYDSGDEDVFRPRLRNEFGSYELHQMSAYIQSMVPRMSRE